MIRKTTKVDVLQSLKLDNAVQGSHYINNIVPSLFLHKHSGELSMKTIFTLLLNRNDLFSTRLIIKLNLNLPSRGLEEGLVVR